jgi:hypothetical protein
MGATMPVTMPAVTPAATTAVMAAVRTAVITAATPTVITAAMPKALDARPGRRDRRGAGRRFDHLRSRPPALFDRSEVLGAIPGGRRGTTMGEDRAGAAADARLDTRVAGPDGGWGLDVGAGPIGGSTSGVDGVPGSIEPARSGARRRPVRPAAAPIAAAARGLLADASLGLGRACAAGDPADRYAIAHLAALRGAAAVLAARARPTRGRQGSAWTLMTRVAPEFAEWAAFFAAGSAKRQAVQAGLPARVSAREADDLVRQVAMFLSLVGDSIGSDTGR